MKSLLLVLLMLATEAFAADRLPKSMLGAWATDLSACGEQASEAGLTVEPKSLNFLEQTHTVRSISKLKNGALKVTGYSINLDGRGRASLVVKLETPDLLVVGEQTFHRCKNEKQKP